MLKLIIPSNIQAQFVDQLSKNGKNETGGILFAEKISNCTFKINEITSQKVGGTKFYFLRQWSLGLSQFFNNFFKKTNYEYSRFNYIGEWHSHPLFEVYPSQTDITSMNELMSDKILDANFLVLLIIKTNINRDLEGSATCFLKNGIMEEAEIEWEEVFDGNC